MDMDGWYGMHISVNVSCGCQALMAMPKETHMSIQIGFSAQTKCSQTQVQPTEGPGGMIQPKAPSKQRMINFFSDTKKK